MRTFILLLISGVYLISCGKANPGKYSSYPDVMTVAEKLDEDHKIFGSATVSFTLAKKPKGWFVVKMDYATNKPVAEELYWSAATNSYQEIPNSFFLPNESMERPSSFRSQVRSMAYSYDHNIYFGYEGWEDDAVNELEGKELNDTLYEALARAYAGQCTGFSRSDRKNMTKRSGEMTQEETEDFCTLGNKLIETYKKLEALNPDYETMVGKVHTKLSNEYLFLWSELKQSKKDKEAAQFFPDGLYDPLMLNFAKNMLNSAEPNAIIFVNGDNDTYPLWYAQAKLGVRKDVAVINTSLINIPNWLLSQKNEYKIAMQFPDEFYRDTLNETIFASRDEMSTYGILTIKEGLENNKPGFSTDYNNKKIPVIPFNHIRLSWTENDSLAPVVAMGSSYLLRSDLAIMDIIASNLGKRPVYFAQTALYSGMAQTMKDNLLVEGLLAKVVGGKNPGFVSRDTYYDLDKFSQQTLSYNYEMGNTKKLQVEPIAMNYLYNFYNLNTALLEQGDTIRARKVTATCAEKMDVVLLKDPAASYLLGEMMCVAGNKEEAHRLFKATIAAIEADLPKQKEQYTLQRYSSTLSSISMNATKYGLSDLVRPANELQSAVGKKLEREEVKTGRN